MPFSSGAFPASACLVLLTVLAPLRASAVVDAQNFHPVGDQKGYFHVSRTEPLDGGVLSGGLFFNYAVNPIQAVIDGRTVDVTTSLWTTDFLLGYGILPWWDIAVDLPLAGIQNETFAKDDAAFGIGDIRIETKVNPISPRVAPVGVALKPFLTIPTGDTDNFLGAEGVTAGADLVLDTDVEFVNAALSVGYLFRDHDEGPGDAMTFGAGIGVPIEAIGLDLQAEVYGWSTFEDFMSAEETSPVEGVVGAVYHLEPLHVDITLGVGVGFNGGIGSADFRVVAGVAPSIVLGEETAERKKVRPVRPAAPALAPAPAAPAPVAPALRDLDGDGTADPGARCPEDPGPSDSFGCPVEGQRAPAAPAAGAPASALAAAARPTSFPPVYFESGSGRILPASESVLERLGQTLRANPDLRVKLEGHTDIQGNRRDNLSLSLRRASYVKSHLVRQGGINPARIQINGLGDEFPVVSNATPEGRARNRRVEIVVIEPAP